MKWTAAALVALTAMAALAFIPEAEAQSQNRCPLDVGFVFDRSGSMLGPNMAVAQAGGVALVDNLTATDQSGVRSFPDQPVDKGLDTNHAATRQGILAGNSPSGGGARGVSDQAKTMDVSRGDFTSNGRGGARHIMLVFSDGANPDSTGVANTAKGQGIEIYSIAIGSGANVAHMRAIASTPVSKYFFHVSLPQDAEAAMRTILQDVGDCAPVPNFTVTLDCAPRLIRFQDTSVPTLRSATIASSRWDWGDGNFSVYNPWNPSVSHSYSQGGTYTVTLNVTDNGGRQAETSQQITIQKCPATPPVADFSCMGFKDPARLVKFTDLSSDWDGTVVAWDWDFADGAQSQMQTPEHTYGAPGAYRVRLTVTDNDGMTDSTTRMCHAVENMPPELDPIPDIEVYAGATIAFNVRAWDPEGDPLLYFMDRADVPGSAIFDAPSFTWETVRGQEGEYGPLTVEVSDGEHAVRESFRITVLPTPPPGPPPTGDGDGDGADDGRDNCPSHPNPGQEDSDGDGIGDACDDPEQAPAPEEGPPEQAPAPADAPAEPPLDTDGDGVTDGHDNCVDTVNQGQADLDGDGIGDACDADVDGDRVNEYADGVRLDNCPRTPNSLQHDTDADGVGDACDTQPDPAEPGEDPAQESNPAQSTRVGQEATVAWSLVGGSLLVLLGLLTFVLVRYRHKE